VFPVSGNNLVRTSIVFEELQTSLKGVQIWDYEAEGCEFQRGGGKPISRGTESLL